MSGFLSDLAPSVVGRVTEVRAESGDAIRLKALGMCLGSQVTVIRAGDPMIVAVLGARVGISARLATQVSVDVA